MSSSPRFRIALVAAGCSLLLAAPAALAAPPPNSGTTSTHGAGGSEVKVDASCAGDTVNGLVHLDAPQGASYTLDLFYRHRGKNDGWLSTGRTASFTSDGSPGTYPYSFDVSAFDAFAYRLAVAGEHEWSRTIPAASCAPGHQLPEAPFALMLPLSLFGTSAAALLFGRRKLFR